MSYTKKEKRSTKEKKADVDGIDESIFLLIQNHESREYFWYVIEEKRIHDHDYHDLLELNEVDVNCTNKGSIDIVTASIRDRIRAFRLPVISDDHLNGVRIVVLNSCICLIGCRDGEDDVQFCDLKLINKGWQEGPSLDGPASYETVAATKNGSILTDFNLTIRQNDCLWLNSLQGEAWKPVPKPPYKICPSFDRVDFDRPYGLHPSLVALTDTNGFWYDPENSSLICFDFVKWEWEFFAEISNDYVRFRFQGVVLYDSYLFSYGIRNESDINEKEKEKEKKKFSLCAYDLIKRRFLSKPIISDDQCPELLPPIDVQHPMELSYNLFKVGDNKLAFVWKHPSKGCSSPDVVYWTKLIIHKKSNGSKVRFRGEVYSHGQCVINGWMIGCAARVTIREEHEGILARKRAGKECRKMVEQEFKDSEFNNIQNVTSDSEFSIYTAKDNTQGKRKKRKVSSKLYSQLDHPYSSIDSRRRDLPGCSIHEVVKVLRGLPGIVKGDELFLKAVRSFTKRENREAFNALEEHDLQVAWLKLITS